uniref:Endonuclease GajA/Old nuclease/RecF-like AAA domain-containing protein n=2 Tax=Acidianus brierleyi TaxID=41673 RepID=A0A2U9ICX5_9CREN
MNKSLKILLRFLIILVMELLIKSLGPITDSKVAISDLTVLFGPPKAGKSYILKAIYSKLAFFDEANNLELSKIFVRQLQDKLISFASEEKGETLTLDVEKEFLISIKTLSQYYLSYLTSNAEVDIPLKMEDIVKEILRDQTLNEETYYPYSTSCVNVIKISFQTGKINIRVSAKKEDRTCQTILASELISSLTNYSIKLFTKILNLSAKTLNIPLVKYAAYGRALALLTLNDVTSFNPSIRSLYYWLMKGLESKAEDSFLSFIDVNIKKSEKDKILIDEYTPEKSSSSLNDLAVIKLMVADGKKSLILIEEPESQLNIEQQIKVALYLYGLAQKHQVVITTHSDVILLILSALQYFGWSNVFEEEAKVPHEKSVNIRIYLVKDGKVTEKKGVDLLENIPTISEVGYKIISIIGRLLDEQQIRRNM